MPIPRDFIVLALLVAVLTGGGQSVLKADSDPSMRHLIHLNAHAPKLSKLSDDPSKPTSVVPAVKKNKGDDDGGTDAVVAECNESKKPFDCGKASRCGDIHPPRHGGIQRNGTVIRYYCNHGYTLVGQRSNKCVKRNGKYQWRNRAPAQCRRVRFSRR